VKYFLATLIIILVGLYKLGSAPLPQTQAVQAPAAAPTNDRETWGMAFLAGIGNAAPTADTLAFVVAWQAGENTTAAYNPLATTQNADGATCFNYINGKCGVKNYTSYEQGLQATIETITNGYYQHIWYGLQTNQPDIALNDQELATWGTGRGNVEQGWIRQQGSRATDVRQGVIQTALAQVGKLYILGTAGPSSFDCSGLVQWSYAQHGIETTRTTFTQLDALRPIEPNQIQPGDMVYFQYSWDQHTGILADVDGDGKWDMIHAAAPGLGVIVTSDVFSDSFYTDAIVGYRTAI
jgi:cell wall-associated NlpC family hydrolase